MLSKSEKNMFYYLGLSLLVLIVLGVLFGVSSVKESFGNPIWAMARCCIKAGAPGDQGKTRKEWCLNDIKKNGNTYKTNC